MTWGHPERFKVYLLAGDCLIAVLALFVGAVIRFGEPVNVFVTATGATATITILYLFALYVLDLYNAEVLRYFWGTAFRVSLACAIAATMASLIFYWLPFYRIERGVVIIALPSIVVVSIAWRMIFLRWHPVLLKSTRVVVIGCGSGAAVLEEFLRTNPAQYQCMGFVCSSSQPNEAPAVSPSQIFEWAKLELVLKEGSVKDVVIACSHLTDAEEKELTRLRFHGYRIHHGTDICLQVAERIPLELVSDQWLWHSPGSELLVRQTLQRIRRLIDILLAGICLLLSLPVWGVIAAAIALDSAGPVLFSQIRVGKDGEVFRMLKFRSMDVKEEGHHRAQWTKVADPRVTRVGQFLRVFHLDELPQLMNILRGEMSFLGPRPEQPDFVDELRKVVPHYDLRHVVPPGLTGWGQVNYPYGASVDDARIKLEYDLYYILNWSFMLDLRTLLRTVRVVLFKKGSR